MWKKLDDVTEVEPNTKKKRIIGKTAPGTSSSSTTHEAEGRPIPEPLEELQDTKKIDKVVNKKVLLVDVFGGISASRVALLAGGLEVAEHFYVEIHDPAIKIVTAWFDNVTRKGDIRELVKLKEAFAKEIWQKAEEAGVAVVLWSAGFPCRELSSVSLNRRGLKAGKTARFEEAKEIYAELQAARPLDAVWMAAVWECVQSMTDESRDQILQE